MWDNIKLKKKKFCTAKESIIKIKKNNLQNEEKKYVQMELISKIYKEHKSIFKIGRGSESPFSPKKIYEWPLSIQKGAQCHLSPQKCKLKAK